METALQKLAKILELERQGGYKNRAVIGGIERYIPIWIEEARRQAGSEAEGALVEQVGELLMDYGQLGGVGARARLVESIGERLAKTIGASPAADQPAPARSVQQLSTADALEVLEQPTPAPAEAGPVAEPKALPKEAPPPQAPGKPTTETRRPQPASRATPPARPPAPGGLEAQITTVRGIGPRLAEHLGRLGITTIQDMLTLYPRRYVDYSLLKPINRLRYDEQVTIIGTIWETSVQETRRGQKIVRSIIGDGTATVQCTWFNQPWLGKGLRAGATVMISGRVDQYLGRLVFTSPEWELVEKEQLHTGRIVPIYPLTAGLNGKTLRSQIKRVVDYWALRSPDPLPLELRERQGLVNLETALLQIHFPDSWDSLAAARRRLIFDELLVVQLGMLRLRHQWRSEPAEPLAVEDGWLDAFIDRLPFALTHAQRRALTEVRQDMATPVPMNRLLQGDVGSGKTVVAAAAMASAVQAGAQAALMAPTEILAEQHANSIRQILEPHLPGIQVRLLTGSVPPDEKEAIYQELVDGTAQVVIGTHALIQTGVAFQNLGLAIVDEQHRFGVEQRGALRQKGYNPHLLVMTATPIPRTLALTLYGDLDISLIDEMPPGRQVVETRWLRPGERERAYNFIRSQVEQGRQAFVICPLVEASDKSEAKAATEEHQRLQKEVFPNLKLDLLHGRMKGADKEAVMAAFYRGETHALVSTSVVEVGIDVPNATVMLVEGANRFGLAQLHQFRGRVGRGEHQSYCLLVADSTTAEAEERLSALEQTNDGFVLAEKDLELRGPGEFFGTRQSGLPDLKLASLSDVPMLEKVRQEAHELVAQDPLLEAPEHRLLARKVDQFWSDRGDVS